MTDEETAWDYLDDGDSFNLLPDNRHATQTADQRLYAAVIIQAMLDATRSITDDSRPETVSATREARVWFETSGTPMAEWFEVICSNAGYSAHTMRSFYTWLRDGSRSLNRRKMSSLIKKFEEEEIHDDKT